MIFCTNDVPNDRKKDTCSGGNKTEAIEKLLAAGAEAGATLFRFPFSCADYDVSVRNCFCGDVFKFAVFGFYCNIFLDTSIFSKVVWKMLLFLVQFGGNSLHALLQGQYSRCAWCINLRGGDMVFFVLHFALESILI